MTITLLNGQEIDSAKVEFFANTQRFYLRNADGSATDISDLLRQADKITLGGDKYDPHEDLIRKSERKQGKKAPTKQSTSIGQVLSDTITGTEADIGKAADKAAKVLAPVALIVLSVLAFLVFLELKHK